MLDSSGNTVVQYKYDAYGNCTRLASANNDLAQNNPIRYRSYYFDEDTGLYYLNTRYYNPAWRRFISPDDSAFLDPENATGLNLYAYCGNDPVNYKQKLVYSGSSNADFSVSSIVSDKRFHPSSVSSNKAESTKVNWGSGVQIPIWISSLVSSADFGASIAPALRTIYQYVRYPVLRDLNKLYGLDFVPGKLNTVCKALGFGLLGVNATLSAIYNFSNTNLTVGQQWISFGVDTAYTLGTFGIGYGVGTLVSLIPVIGVFIAPFVSAGVTWFIDWTNQMWGWLDDIKQWFNDL